MSRTRIVFDSSRFIEDLKIVIDDAKRSGASLIVVPTEREVKTIERNFGDECNINGIMCCTFSDYVSFNWLTMFGRRPRKIFIFRIDDIVNTYAADADVEYITIGGRKNYKKEENINEAV